MSEALPGSLQQIEVTAAATAAATNAAATNPAAVATAAAATTAASAITVVQEATAAANVMAGAKTARQQQQ